MNKYLCTVVTEGGQLKRGGDYVDFDGETLVGTFIAMTPEIAEAQAVKYFKEYEFEHSDIQNLDIAIYELK